MSVCKARRPGPMPYRAFMIVPYDRAGERPRAVSELIRMKPLAEAVARESGHAFNGTPGTLFACGKPQAWLSLHAFNGTPGTLFAYGKPQAWLSLRCDNLLPSTDRPAAKLHGLRQSSKALPPAAVPRGKHVLQGLRWRAPPLRTLCGRYAGFAWPAQPSQGRRRRIAAAISVLWRRAPAQATIRVRAAWLARRAKSLESQPDARGVARHSPGSYVSSPPFFIAGAASRSALVFSIIVKLL